MASMDYASMDYEYENQDEYDRIEYQYDDDDYGQPIIYICAHGNVILDVHPEFVELSAPQNIDYKHTSVFWLTDFGTTLRAHNWDSGCKRMLDDSMAFVFENKLTSVNDIDRPHVRTAWNGHINNKEYARKLGLNTHCEPTIPWELQDNHITGVQRYQMTGLELYERKLYDDDKYNDEGEPWGIWIYNRTKEQWEPVEGFQQDIDDAYNNYGSMFEFTLDEVFSHVQENYNGLVPIVFSFSCRTLDLPDDSYINLISQTCMDASIQRRLEDNRIQSLDELYDAYIVLTTGLLERLIESMRNSYTKDDFDVDLADYRGLGYNWPSRKKINKYIKWHADNSAEDHDNYGYGTRKPITGKQSRKSKQNRSKKNRSKKSRSKQSRSKQSRSKKSRSKKSRFNNNWDKTTREKYPCITKRKYTRDDYKNYLKVKKRRDARNKKKVIKMKKSDHKKSRQTRRHSKRMNKLI